jgi:hypothetical protein
MKAEPENIEHFRQFAKDWRLFGVYFGNFFEKGVTL